MLGATDEAHFAFAQEKGRTIVTHNEDFLRLAAQADDHAGVVYLPQHRSIGETVRGLALIAGVLDVEGMRRHVEFLGAGVIFPRYNHALQRTHFSRRAAFSGRRTNL
jgi:hypothetical protein